MSTANTAALPALAATGSDPRAKVAFKETPEAEVVRRAQGGDEAAFRQLVERHRTKVFSAIYGIVRRRNDAEDIAQQVFAKVYFSLKSFDFRSSLTTWIYRIAVNECYDYLRKQKVRKLVYESDLATDDARTIEDSSLAVARTPSAAKATEQRDFLMKLLEYISEDDRILLLQKEVEGFTIEELAYETGLNENTIKVKLFRARQKLVKAAEKLGRLPSA
ncbi:MAG: RNA polymerase subunit sigma-24 [Solibacterales bacterium]|nr:RNA polymerase subunit sigma-24 [Bryobacterales bacterium]|tara:strand:+ start:1095 stop:1751 length:657 start_codon:yes stop_codon:yes gene_type:complete